MVGMYIRCSSILFCC